MQSKFILDIDACGEFSSIEEARDRLEGLAAYAREKGLTIVGGHAGIVREREPIQTYTLGSDEPFRNMTSQEGTPQAQRFERTLTTA